MMGDPASKFTIKSMYKTSARMWPNCNCLTIQLFLAAGILRRLISCYTKIVAGSTTMRLLVG
jgi:hypothetical protein